MSLLIRMYVSRYALLVIVFSIVQGFTIDKIRLHYANDFRNCPETQYDHHFNVTDDLNCHLLFPANESKKLGPCYYQTFTDGATKRLAFIGRCDCEYIAAIGGHRVYNRSCSIGRLSEETCLDLSGIRKGKAFTKYFNSDVDIRYVSLDTSE